MRRVFLLASILSAFAGCTAILGTFDVSSSGSDGGGNEGGPTLADGSVGDAALQPETSTPIIIEGGTSNCSLLGDVVQVDEGSKTTLSSVVRVYHQTSIAGSGTAGARVVDFSAVGLTVFDIADNSTGVARIDNSPTYAQFLNVRRATTSLSFLTVTTPPTHLSLSKIDDGVQMFGPSTTASSTTTTPFTTGSFTAANVTSTFLALGYQPDAGAANELYGSVASTSYIPTPIHTDSSPDNVHIVNVVDDVKQAYIFTTGNIVAGTLPMYYVTSDSSIVANGTDGGVTPSPATNIPQTEMLDFSAVGTQYGATLVRVSGTTQIDLLGGIVGSPLSSTLPLAPGAVPVLYSFTNPNDVPTNGDTRWEYSPAGQLVLVGGAGSEPGMNMIWYDQPNATLREAFTGPNRLFPKHNIAGASATVSGNVATGKAVTVDIAWTELSPNGADYIVYYQRASCQL